MGWPGPVDKSEGFRWAVSAPALSIKVRDFVALGWTKACIGKNESLEERLAESSSINVTNRSPCWLARRSKGLGGQAQGF